MKIEFATQRSARTSDLSNKQADSFAEFFDEHLSSARISPEKDGITFIPSTFRAPSRLATNVIKTSMVVFDIDQKPEDDIITLEEIEDVMLDMSVEHVLYTSYSNTKETPRFRLIMPLSRAVYPEEFQQVAAGLLEDIDDFLDGRLLKVVDGCWKEISRCYFTYTVHPDRQEGATSWYHPGHLADVDDLKMRGSTYGLDHVAQKTPGTRIGHKGIGAKGRSLELAKLVAGMRGTATEEEIVTRLMAHDTTSNAGDEYFADDQYPAHRMKPGESRAQSSLRACRSFVRSHIYSLKRSDKAQDFKIINCPGKNRGPIPGHDAIISVWKTEKQVAQGKEKVKLSCKVISGEHAGSIFWHTVFGPGHSDKAIEISRQLASRAAIATKTDIKDIQDMIKLSGKIVKARIKLKPGTNGYPDQNEIGAIYIE